MRRHVARPGRDAPETAEGVAVLPKAHRLTRRADFDDVVRQGHRAGRRLVAVHLLVPAESVPAPPRAGLVVSKGVGGSVVRHRVARRLRALLRDRLDRLPGGARLVVRAAPASADANSAALGAELDSALEAALRRGTSAATRR